MAVSVKSERGCFHLAVLTVHHCSTEITFVSNVMNIKPAVDSPRVGSFFIPVLTFFSYVIIILVHVQCTCMCGIIIIFSYQFFFYILYIFYIL